MGEFLEKYWSQCMVLIGLVVFVLQQAWLWHYKKKERFYDRYRPLIDDYLDAIDDFIDDLKTYELHPLPSPQEMDAHISYPAFKVTRIGGKLSFYSDDEVRIVISDIKKHTADFLYKVSQIYKNAKVDNSALNNFGIAKKEYMEQMIEQLDLLSIPIKKYLRQ